MRKWNNWWKCGLVLSSILVLAACGKVRTGGTVSVVTPDFFGIGEDLASQLDLNRKGSRVENRRLLLTTVVSLDSLYQTSKFGRALTEALSTRLFKHGFGVIEMRKAPDILVRDDAGELILTREAKLMADQHDADAIIAGTYSLTPSTVIINLRMLGANSNEVLSVAGLEIQRSYAINYLLSEGQVLGDAELSVYERQGG